MNEQFLYGFMVATGINNRVTADEQWAGWSRQLPDEERDEIEAGGYDSGYKEGKAFFDSVKDDQI